MEQSEKTLDMIVNLCKNRGYVFPGSEIYGGLANSWVRICFAFSTFSGSSS